MPAIIEREVVSPSMQNALHAHIIREREKRKQEVAKAEKDSERKAKEEEEARKKIEEDNSTLEDIKDQLLKLKEKLEELREHKHQLFWQFKKVLSEESKRKRLREQSELANSQYAHQGLINHPLLAQGPGPRLLPQPGTLQPGLLQGHQIVPHGVKRPHSPSSPAGVIQMYAKQTLGVHSSPQHRPDLNQHGQHGSYLSPIHGQQTSSSASGLYPSYTFQPSASDRVKQEIGGHLDEQVRSRIRMIPSGLSQQQTWSPFNIHTGSNSPERYGIPAKSENSPFSIGSPNKYSTAKQNSRPGYMKH